MGAFRERLAPAGEGHLRYDPRRFLVPSPILLMVQLGFVIDHSRCIGCHACTVACKSENQVPLGNFRTWVKYTESGTFPDVRRSFAVLRCNQCSDAPCMTICPVTALDKRPDGIVDLDQDVCIGCKGCMQACPYDALYLNESEGTVEKCHFCAHRVEQNLAPACAVVCPTEAIVPGDFDDPNSRVSKLKSGGELTARKLEAGTNPNVWYRDVNEAGIDPALTNNSGGYLWANQIEGENQDAQRFLAESIQQSAARTTYNVDHKLLWGGLVSSYLLTKGLSAGAFLAMAAIMLAAGTTVLSGTAAWLLPLIGIFFLLVTTGLLVGDLKRPDRFLSILKRPNWSSWIARGTVVLITYGGLLGIWFLAGVFDMYPSGGLGQSLSVLTAIAAALTACYTAWLFAQAKGRVLWMRRGLAAQLVAQAMIAGSATALLLAPILSLSDGAVDNLRWSAVAALILNLGFALGEKALAPAGREAEYERVASLITKGPYARRHWTGVVVGIAIPAILLVAFASPAMLMLASALALVGLWIEEDILVRAGQALPIS